MKPSLALIACLALVSCSKTEEAGAGTGSDVASKKVSQRPSVEESDTGPSLRDLHRVPVAERPMVFRDLLLITEDTDVDLAMEAVERIDSAEEKLDLLYLLADDLEGRDEMVRLPSLFWIASNPSTDQGLKTTVLADLRRELDLKYQPDLATLAEKLEDHLGDNGVLR